MGFIKCIVYIILILYIYNINNKTWNNIPIIYNYSRDKTIIIILIILSIFI